MNYNPRNVIIIRHGWSVDLTFYMFESFMFAPEISFHKECCTGIYCSSSVGLFSTKEYEDYLLLSQILMNNKPGQFHNEDADL